VVGFNIPDPSLSTEAIVPADVVVLPGSFGSDDLCVTKVIFQ
jgi:hypothetical protein